MATYHDLYKEFCDKMGLIGAQKDEFIADYRPAKRPYIDFIKNSDGTNIYVNNGIIVWLKDGTTMIYVGKG